MDSGSPQLPEVRGGGMSHEWQIESEVEVKFNFVEGERRSIGHGTAMNSSAYLESIGYFTR